MTANVIKKPACHTGMPILDDLARQIDRHERSANKLRRLFRLLQELHDEGTLIEATTEQAVRRAE